MPLTFAYFGSPDFSARFLEQLLTDKETKRLIEVKLVVTQPDKPVGRKQILTPTPVKLIAEKHKIKIKYKITNPKFQIPNNIQIPNSKLHLEFGAWCLEFGDLNGIDFALVYAYNQIIPKDYLSLPRYGFWCIHPSLLPKYRGPSPIATALINGDKETGVSIFKMDEKIDHGPIIAQEKTSITPTDLRPDLERKLTDLAFVMFKKILLKSEDTFFETIARGSHRGVAVEKNGIELLKEQNHKQATYTKKLKKEDGFISFENLKLKIENSPEKLFNLFRGLYPWPGLWTILPNGKRLKITGLQLQPTTYSLQPTHYKLQPTKVQLEGKKEVDFATFNRAYKVF
jgi:methionyl-tRNA formyltransferase